MKKYTFLFLYILITSFAFAQEPVTFDKLISRVTKPYYEDTFPDALYPGDNLYKIKLRDQPLPLILKDTVIKNPNNGARFISAAVLLRDNLVMLSETGMFVCYHANDLSRNEEFEKQLNTKQWRSHQILNNRLIAQSDEQSFYFTADNAWEPYKATETWEGKPTLYEDEAYICFSECHGEWGGRVYFFDKQTGRTYFARASCARSVMRKAGIYYVLSSLGHLESSSALIAVADPRKLSEITSEEVHKSRYPFDRRSADTSQHAVGVFDVYGMLVPAIFKMDDRIISLGRWRKQTFLCEIEGNKTTIVHPLFKESFFPLSASTNGYGDIQLVNVFTDNWYNKDADITFVIKGNQLTRIVWNRALPAGD